MTKVLKIDYSPYTLTSKQAPNSKTQSTERHGCLLRFTFKDFGYGYADCHPLVEFGDDSVENQLAALKQKKFTNITQRSLHFATLDAQSRSYRSAPFDEISLYPTNHYTSPALIKKEAILIKKAKGFTTFKFKCGNHIPNEINYVQNMAELFRSHNLKMRLDFNGNFTHKSTLEEFKPYADIIEFIEDPFSTLNEKTKLTLNEYSSYFKFAMDFVQTDDPTIKKLFDYRIIKPARENIAKLKISPKQRVIFTSSMDHPFGQMCALYDACLYLQKNVSHSAESQTPLLDYGLMTQHLLENNKYSELLNVHHTKMFGEAGTGFGFDNLLKEEKWKKCF